MKWIYDPIIKFVKSLIYQFRYTFRAYLNVWDKRKYKPGTLIQSCSYYPGIVLEIDSTEGTIILFDLITGDRRACSITSCGVKKLFPKEVVEMIEEYKLNGDRGLLIKYNGWTEKEYNKFMKKHKK